MLIRVKASGEDISDLAFARNEMDMDVTPMNMISDEIKISFNILGASMVHGINNYICG